MPPIAMFLFLLVQAYKTNLTSSLGNLLRGNFWMDLESPDHLAIYREMFVTAFLKIDW
jgi:hypothetical protein